MSENITIDAFDVLTLSNEGVKVPLSLPNGDKTEHYLVVVGLDSERFQGALAVSNRKSITLAAKREEMTPEEQREEQKEENRWLAAHLVTEWSFDHDCNLVNIIEFFKKAPQVQEEIDNFAGNRENFMRQSFSEPPAN